MNYKTGYQIDTDGGFIGVINIRENPRVTGDFPCSKSIVFTSPKTLEKYQTQKWNGEEWIIYNDYRGKYFNKLTAEELVIEDLDIVVDFEKYTSVPPDGRFFYQYFNNVSGVWEEDIITKTKEENASLAKEKLRQLNALDVKKMRYLFESMEGDETGKEYFNSLQAETKALRAEYQELKAKLDKEE